MFDTFAVEPFGFVRKGHFMEDLNEVITRFVQKQKTRKTGDMVCFQDGRGTVSVDITRVKYIECVRNTQIMYFDGSDAERKIYSRMETLEEELRKNGFIRIHKGYLANCRYIARFGPKCLYLITQEQLPIGRSYYQSAKVEHLEYISRTGAASSSTTSCFAGKFCFDSIMGEIRYLMTQKHYEFRPRSVTNLWEILAE